MSAPKYPIRPACATAVPWLPVFMARALPWRALTSLTVARVQDPEALRGLLQAPTDGGRALRAGLEGALGSLPELAFVNLRKGSYDYVSGEDRAALRSR